MSAVSSSQGVDGAQPMLCPADFFVSCINVRLPVAILIMALGYTCSFLFWALGWFALYR